MNVLKVIFSFAFVCSTAIGHAQSFFSEVSQEVGLSDSSWGEDGNENYGGGISFFDFDNDGWDDLTISSNSGFPVRFYRNINGAFEPISLEGINDNLFETKSVQWVDIDNDGDYDFFATSNQTNGDNRLYINTGDLLFIEETAAAGLSNPGHKSFGSSWGDYNNDGFLDVFIVSRFFDSEVMFNTLYRNNGNGTFTDVSLEATLLQENSLSFCSSWIDYNNDGWQDIYISNDKVQNKNMLYQNNGDGTFTNVAQAAGVALAIDAMSTTISDYNNDGWLDIYVANTQAGNAFLRNNGDGTFTDIAAANGTLFNSVAWGSVFLDGDNDTDIDLYVSASVTNVDSGQLSAAYYQNDGNGVYEIPENIGLDNDVSTSYSNAIGDLDNDGRVDIAVLNCLPDNVFLWKNESVSENNWIKIKLEGTESNRQGVGSFIEISVNGEKQYQYTLIGEGYLGQNSSYEFFGIGTATQIDHIKVRWLSGIEDVIFNPEINVAHTVIEGENTLGLSSQNEAVISLFPNPSTSTVQISGLHNYVNGTISILDLKGKLVKKVLINTPSLSLDIRNLQTEMYILQIQLGEVSTFKKLLKM